jgi:hypothetical protein
LQINRIAVVIVFAPACRWLVLVVARVMVMLALVMAADARQVDVRLRGVVFVTSIAGVRVRGCRQLPGKVSKCGQQ